MASAPAARTSEHAKEGAEGARWLVFAWGGTIALALGVRVWNALVGPVLYGYDGWAHITYVLFLDTFHALPWADQGWSFFHPPLYYLVGLGIAQFGSAEMLARGLALVSSIASLGIAWLVARIAASESPTASLGAFCALAFLPVHLYVSPMPGNEMTAAFFGTATLAVFIENQRRLQKSRALDAATGLLGALALLSKFNGALALGCVGVVGVVQALRGDPEGRVGRLWQFAARATTIAAVVVLIAGPWYARNLGEFGNLFQTSHEVAEVKAEEAMQPPGERGVRDFLSFLGPAVFEDSSFDAPNVVRSVWGTVYLNLWFDTFRGGQFPKLTGPPVRDYPIHRWTIAMALVGLVPTMVALFGALRSARIVWRDPEAVVDAVAWVLLLAGLTAFVLFAIRVPTFAAVKASYLLNLSLAWGWFSVRGVQGLAAAFRSPALRIVAVCGAVVPLACVGVFTSGLLVPMSRDHSDMQALRSYFGDAESARVWFADPRLEGMRWAIEEMAAIEMSHGNSARARELWRSVAGGAPTPRFVNAMAAATALEGGHRQAYRLWDQLIAASAMPEALSNRGALRALDAVSEGAAARRELDAARRDVETALAAVPDLVAGWRNLAEIEKLAGNSEGAAVARRKAEFFALGAPRGFPHGVGDGELRYTVQGQRWLLVLRDGALELYRPSRSRIEWGS